MEDRILTEQDFWNEELLRKHLQTKWLAGTIYYAKKMDSTNIQAKQHGEEGAEHGLLVVTGKQTAGKGRRGRRWNSPEGNCYFSILLRPKISPGNVSMLTLIAAMGVAKAVKEIAGLDTAIKWPNDVVANGKKLCGILTESSTNSEGVKYLVVGIGINVNQAEFAEEIKGTASSIYLETGKQINRIRLIAAFLNAFEEYVSLFLETSDMTLLKAEYNDLLINKDREVRIIEEDRERILTAKGIDRFGGLVVEDENGRRETVISGEVSVRGLYGYV